MPIALIAAALLASATPSPPARLVEDGCSLVAEIDGKSEVFGPLEGLRLLDGPEVLSVNVASGGKLLGLSCDRSSVVPDERDDRVIRQLGVKLYLSGPDDVTVSIALGDDGYVIRAVSGKWSEDDERAIIARINLFNSRLPRSKPVS